MALSMKLEKPPTAGCAVEMLPQAERFLVHDMEKEAWAAFPWRTTAIRTCT
jgi:hypothetical protein